MAVAVVILSVVRVLEFVFPKVSALKSADQSLASLGVKDVDGK
jgi:hypothetical protein